MIPEPERVQQLRTANAQDRDRMVAYEAAEQTAITALDDAEKVVGEAQRLLAEAQEKWDAAVEFLAVKTHEREALAREIEVGAIMLAAAEKVIARPADQLVADGTAETGAIPRLPMPDDAGGRVRIAEPAYRRDNSDPDMNDDDCEHCGEDIAVRGGVWVHQDTDRRECGPPSASGVHPILGKQGQAVADHV